MASKHTIFITGSAKRIGKAIALHMASLGFNVVIHCNNSVAEAEELVLQIKKQYGVDAIFVKADLSDTTQTSLAFKQALKYFGKIDVLINNASMFKNDKISNLDIEQWQQHLNVNLTAPVLLSKLYSDNYKIHDNFSTYNTGNIINIVDYCVSNLPDKFFSYSISKYSLWGVTKSLAKQLAPNIRVNAIALGHSLANDKESKESFNNVQLKTPLKNGADLQEICNSVKFILDSISITGTMLSLDGGKHLIGAEFY